MLLLSENFCQLLKRQVKFVVVNCDEVARGAVTKSKFHFPTRDGLIFGLTWWQFSRKELIISCFHF